MEFIDINERVWRRISVILFVAIMYTREVGGKKSLILFFHPPIPEFCHCDVSCMTKKKDLFYVARAWKVIFWSLENWLCKRGEREWVCVHGSKMKESGANKMRCGPSAVSQGCLYMRFVFQRTELPSCIHRYIYIWMNDDGKEGKKAGYSLILSQGNEAKNYKAAAPHPVNLAYLTRFFQ